MTNNRPPDAALADRFARFASFQMSTAVLAADQGVLKGPGWDRTDVRSEFAHIARWGANAYYGGTVDTASSKRCAVILLSYLRQDNIDALVRSYLRCGFVGQMLVCNNNPAVRIGDYLAVEDPRLRVIQREVPTRQGIRIPLATSLTEFDYLVTIDDDVFLEPEQMRVLFEHLVANPSAPHGVRGERRAPPGDTNHPPDYPYNVMIGNEEAEVEHLTNAYFFTRQQALRAEQLAKRFHLGDLDKLGNGEDILLSLSGTRRPRIHSVGKIVECFSAMAKGIATAFGDNFFGERSKFVDSMASAYAELEP